MVEILIAIGCGILLVWGFMLGGIFEGSYLGTDNKVIEDLNETIRNRNEK